MAIVDRVLAWPVLASLAMIAVTRTFAASIRPRATTAIMDMDVALEIVSHQLVRLAVIAATRGCVPSAAPALPVKMLWRSSTVARMQASLAPLAPSHRLPQPRRLLLQLQERHPQGHPPIGIVMIIMAMDVVLEAVQLVLDRLASIVQTTPDRAFAAWTARPAVADGVHVVVIALQAVARLAMIAAATRCVPCVHQQQLWRKQRHCSTMPR